jgi:hypothetical protein
VAAPHGPALTWRFSSPPRRSAVGILFNLFMVVVAIVAIMVTVPN